MSLLARRLVAWVLPLSTAGCAAITGLDDLTVVDCDALCDVADGEPRDAAMESGSTDVRADSTGTAVDSSESDANADRDADGAEGAVTDAGAGS